MAEYIDREALLANLKRQYGEDLGWQCTVNMSDVGMMIEDAPAADVVEVVRCEKCFFAEMVVDIIGDPHLYCTEKGFREVDFDDFCSHGKRSSK